MTHLLILAIAILVASLSSTDAFTAVSPITTPLTPARSPHRSTPTFLAAKRKSKAQLAEEAEKYWQGEWVCKDCGYIYQKSECAGMYFEEQGVGFRCPQCSGPRRRYAKKVGDRVGTTLDGGDAPILIFSFGGLAATIAFGVWAVNNL